MPRKAYASVATPRIHEEIPNFSQQAVASGIFTGRRPSASINMAAAGSPAVALERARRYGNGRYFYGPTIIETTLDDTSREDVWFGYINANFPIMSPQYYFIISQDVQLPGIEGLQDYVGDFALQNNPIPAPDTFSRFEYLGTTVNIYKLSAGVESLHLAVNNPILTQPQHYIRYQLVENEVALETKVEIYNQQDGYLPELHVDEFFVEPLFEDDMYPLVPMRINGVDYLKEKELLGNGTPKPTLIGDGLEGGRSIRNMMRRLSINPDDIVEAIKSNVDEDGNDVSDDIDDVFIGFGLNPALDEEWSIAGLAETFFLLNERKPDTETIFNSQNIRQNITFKTSTEGSLDSTLSYNFIRVERFQGEVEYSKTFTPGSSTEVCYPNQDPNGPPICNTSGSTNEYVYMRPVRKLDTEIQEYDVITVSGLTQVHRIAVPDFGIKEVRMTEGDEEELLVPLLKGIPYKVPYKLRDAVAFGSMRLYIYTYQVIRLKWYQTGIFKAILVIIALVIAYFTWGASVSAGFSAGAVAGLLVVAEIVITLILVNKAVQWLIEEVGGTLGVVLAILVVVFAGGGNFDFSTITATLSTTWYAAFTAAVRVYGVYVTEQGNEIQAQQAAFDIQNEERQEELEAAQETLDYGVKFDFLEAIEYRSLPSTDPGETPSSFYFRTSEVVDLPAISNSLVTNYHEAQLVLPVVDSYVPPPDNFGV